MSQICLQCPWCRDGSSNVQAQDGLAWPDYMNAFNTFSRNALTISLGASTCTSRQRHQSTHVIAISNTLTNSRRCLISKALNSCDSGNTTTILRVRQGKLSGITVSDTCGKVGRYMPIELPPCFTEQDGRWRVYTTDLGTSRGQRRRLSVHQMYSVTLLSK